MNFFQQLKQKPWAAEQGAVDDLHEGGEFSLPTPEFGLRVFLGVATVLFTLFIVVYLERMGFPDWRPLHEPWVLWVNTAVLILSSLAFQRAWINADRGHNMDGVKNGLLAAGGFAFAFLAAEYAHGDFIHLQASFFFERSSNFSSSSGGWSIFS